MKELEKFDYKLELASGDYSKVIPVVFTIYDVDSTHEDYAKLVKSEEYGRKLFVLDLDFFDNGDKGVIVEVKHKHPEKTRDSGHDDLAEAFIRVKSEIQKAKRSKYTLQDDYNDYVNRFFNRSQSEYLMFRRRAVKVINSKSGTGRKTFTYDANENSEFVGLMLGAFYNAGFKEVPDTEKRGGLGDFFRANQ